MTPLRFRTRTSIPTHFASIAGVDESACKSAFANQCLQISVCKSVFANQCLQISVCKSVLVTHLCQASLTTTCGTAAIDHEGIRVGCRSVGRSC